MLTDVQNGKSEFDYPIERVGITDFKLPIYIDKKEGGVQHTVANIDVFVDLKKESKGINMSRLPIGLQKFRDQKLNATVIQDIAEYIRNKSEAEQCQIIYKFPYFINKLAPLSKEPGITYNNIIFDLIKNVNTDFNLSHTEFWMTVE